jgi:N-acetylmuramoyl-L-alanine amidase
MAACSGILYGYYWLFLRNKRFHHYNRFYLLASTVLSVIIPFIKIPVLLEPDTTSGQLVHRSIDLISVNRWEEEFMESTGATNGSWLTLQNALVFSYALVILILLYLLGKSLYYIKSISQKYPCEYINTFKFYNTAEPGTPFSFFRTIFWNKRLDLNSKEGQQIFRHELFHIRQKHSADILFLELASIFFWINPLFHLIKKEMKAIHEFLADQHAVSDANEFEYAELLVLQSIGSKRNTISNYFFQNHIKRRITMITQFKNENYGYWTRLMVLPLSLVLFCTIALYAQNADQTSINPINVPASRIHSKSITVLVDAGHGGEDSGVKSETGLKEKDIALAIAKQMQNHAGDYNINVVMTRKEDSYPTLKERTALAKSKKADILISIHVAATDQVATKSGFEIYITRTNEQTLAHSRILGEVIATQLKNIYEVSSIKQRNEKGIWILDAGPCPAVLIECGYITNEKDVAFISSAENQERVARSILQGIVEYQTSEKTRN